MEINAVCIFIPARPRIYFHFNGGRRPSPIGRTQTNRIQFGSTGFGRGKRSVDAENEEEQIDEASSIVKRAGRLLW